MMPYLHGNRIILREYRREDLEWIRKWANDEEITNTLSDIFLYPHAEQDTEAFLEMMIDSSSKSKGFVIADRQTLDYIGQIDLHQIDWKNRSAVLGIVIGRKDMLGAGYGREAIRLMQKFVFQSLNLNRLELEVYAFNERAHRCYISCGFKEEGRLRQKMFKDGKYSDVIVMSVLKDEYEQTQNGGK